MNEFEEFDYFRIEQKLSDIVDAIKKIKISTGSGNGLSTILDKSGNGINPSTKENQDTQINRFEDVIDGLSNSIKIVDFPHHEIHEGDTFTFCDVVALGNGASQDYIITTPNTTKLAHFGYNIDFNDGVGTVRFFELTDRNGTTLQTAYNRNRNSNNTPTTTIHKGQTGGTTDGIEICHRRAGSGKSLSGTAGSGSERILKANTKYLFRITNETTLTNNVSVEFNWYEHVSNA